MTPEQRRALKRQEEAAEAYEKSGRQEYGSVGDLEFEEFDGPRSYNSQNLVTEDLGSSRMDQITTDPRYKEHELAALRELEDQSKTGFTARDRADMARVENQVNRANRGRLAAIEDNMRQRGMTGSGMELVASMQSSQDANEIAAMKALEQEAMMQDRKSRATMQLGDMSANLQQRDFGQEAAKARAADEIARFNNANRNDARRFNVASVNDAQRFNISNEHDTSRYNNQGHNATAAQNHANAQNISNMNVGGANDWNQSVYNVRSGAAATAYNAATEAENRRLLLEQEKQRRRDARNAAGGQMIGGLVGAGAGAFVGGPAGAALGASAGSSVGGAAGSYVSDSRAKKDIKTEHEGSIEAFLAMLDPKSYSYKGSEQPKHGVLAQDLEKSKIGADMLRIDEAGTKRIDVADAVSGLLSAVAHLNKKIDKKADR